MHALVEDLSQLMVVNHAGGAQEQVRLRLKSCGWLCSLEVRVSDLIVSFDRRRLDLVAKKHGVLVPVEIDNRTPRQRSIHKLKLVGGGVVLLRNPKCRPLVLQPEDVSSEILVVGLTLA